MIKPKRSLGQNFLVDQNIINKIIDIINIQDKSILEIGPGTGNLTKKILEHNPKKITVVEKDTELSKLLNKNLGNKIKIINDDILRIDENKLLEDEPLIVFGNLPYNISTEILCKWILNLKNNHFWFNYLILMFQKEVADRIIANFNTKNYGRLSVLSSWKLEINKICDVKPSSFFPKPKVDSSVLLMKPKVNFFKLKDPKNLEKLTRIFFMHRRKMIKKPFNQLFNGKIEIADRLGINISLRPQNLNIETYYKLTNEFENLRS